jgi:hypothetical protein
MATRRKSTARKSKAKRGKVRSKPRKKTVGRAASRKKKAAGKKRPAKKVAGKRVAQRRKVLQQQRRPAPVVQDTIVDVIDEPLPGVMRVTEIEEVGVKRSEEDDEE